jgi:succinoglycan biosynthesis protein ExoM
MGSIAICVPTYRRPDYLRDCLRSLSALDLEGLSVQVVVVDNDARGSAATVAQRFGGVLPDLLYEIEPERGISAARNRLVAIAARLGAEHVAFIDDDARAEADWLKNLIQPAIDYEADIVAGPSLPEYEPGVPGWVVEGCFFEYPRYRTGDAVTPIGTNNLLIKQAWLTRLPGPFDRRFDLTGGGDSHLLFHLERLGAKMVWSDNAIVHDKVPLSRANAGWLVRRHLRTGMMGARQDSIVYPTPRLRLRPARRAIEEIALGSRDLVRSRQKSRVEQAKALCRGARGLGRLLGLFGFSYQEYRHVH